MRNDAREHDLRRVEQVLDAATFRPAMLGLCEMLQVPAPDDEVGGPQSAFGAMVGPLGLPTVCVWRGAGEKRREEREFLVPDSSSSPS